MKKNKKNRINTNRIIGFSISFIILITSIFSGNITIKANSAQVKSTSNENGVIEIPLKWSRNNMNFVNSDYKTTNSYYTINSNRNYISVNYLNMINENNLMSPKDSYNWIHDKYYIDDGHNGDVNVTGLTGNILRTPMLVNPDESNLYTIDYRNLESWFEPVGSTGEEPVSLPVKGNDIWNENNENSVGWQQSINEDSNLQYKTQDWYMFRGIFDLSNEGINKNNIDDYEFYLAMPDGKMILGANDLISVFVDEHSTKINYATPPRPEDRYGDRKINFITRNEKNSNEFVNKTITYNNLSTDRYGGETDDSGKHGYNGLSLGSSDGWHVDLNNEEKDSNGNVVLGNVTDIIKQNVYGNNKHMIDMLASEWCNTGGMTRLALYAVKKPQITVKKIAYIHPQDESKVNKSELVLDKNGNILRDSDGDIILNTENHIPEIPADVTVYFKFKLTNTGQITVNNIKFKDAILKITYDNENLHGARIVGSSGYYSNLNNLSPGKSITLKDEKNLKYLSDSNRYSDLNKEFTNTVEASGTYFNNQITSKSSSTVNIKIVTESPKVDLTKTILTINRDGKEINYNKDNPISIVDGDKVTFKISLKNNTKLGDENLSLSGLSLSDILNCDDGKKVTYNNEKWKFRTDKNNLNTTIDTNKINIGAGKTLILYTDWIAKSNSGNRGVNYASISYNGKKLDEDRVDFKTKIKTGIINVTKNVGNYSELNANQKVDVDNQLFTINLIDNNDGTIQSVSIKNGQSAQFEGVKYGDSYTIKESIPMNYKLDSIVNNKTNNDTFTMTSDIDNSKVTITNSYSNTGFFDWVENKVNQLKTSNNI
ncbi:DUF5979 domain-containing protein [Clostridium sp. Ade.TY]|uniref:DUF5979 domain-containing protein n=1 Tax=Clostridium sp. Ade.TY TaxID=1391647 RepID=UPI0004283A48|nr:DUF5979 domain-containing protein [Clostridium sp. Ade.TY]